MEQIYKISTGDLIDLDRITSISRLVKRGDGIFEIPIHCTLHTRPISVFFTSDGDGSQPNEGLEMAIETRDKLADEWVRWTKLKNKGAK